MVAKFFRKIQYFFSRGSFAFRPMFYWLSQQHPNFPKIFFHTEFVFFGGNFCVFYPRLSCIWRLRSDRSGKHPCRKAPLLARRDDRKAPLLPEEGWPKAGVVGVTGWWFLKPWLRPQNSPPGQEGWQPLRLTGWWFGCPKAGVVGVTRVVVRSPAFRRLSWLFRFGASPPKLPALVKAGWQPLRLTGWFVRIDLASLTMTFFVF